MGRKRRACARAGVSRRSSRSPRPRSSRGGGSGHTARCRPAQARLALEARPRRRRGWRRGCPPRRSRMRPTRTRRSSLPRRRTRPVVSSPTADEVATKAGARVMRLSAADAARRHGFARNASITATFATIEVADMLRNWIEHAVFVAGLPNVVVIALDEATLSKCANGAFLVARTTRTTRGFRVRRAAHVFGRVASLRRRRRFLVDALSPRRS